MKARRAPPPLLAALAVLATAVAMPGFPAPEMPAPPSSPIAIEARLDWSTRTLELQVELDLAAAGLRLPTGRMEAATRIERDLPAVLKNLVLGLPVDSWRTVDACIQDGSILATDLLGLADLVKEESSSFTKNLRAFHVGYRLSLDSIGALFLHHSRPRENEAPLEYHPSRAFTGIIIYAKGLLPVHGERGEDRLRPCLFPRVYDEDMKLLLDRNAVSPEAILGWGELAYAKSLDASALARIGDDPMRIDARAFFGTQATDILISHEDAMKILALPENRALLAAGRVLVIMDEVSQDLHARP